MDGHDLPPFLYRGVSASQFADASGLRPKATGAFVHAVAYGEWAFGMGSYGGATSINAVIRHQLDQNGNPTSGISTTPLLDRAMFYATNGGASDSGFVVKLDRQRLAVCGVLEFRVSDCVASPSVPEDDEVVLVASDCGCIPSTAIVEVIPVNAHNAGA